MSSQRFLILFATLLISIVCQYAAHCAEVSTTQTETKSSLSGDNSEREKSLGTTINPDHEEVEEEEADEEFSILGYITDDSIRVQAVIKPEQTEANEEKKNTEKKNTEKKNTEKKKKRKDKKKGKKVNPCNTTHKDYCIHGTCKYIERMKEVACRCQQNYFGERCSEQSLKTQTPGELSDVSTVALAVVAVLLSTISIIAIIIIIVVHTRRKYSYECESEEKKKLGQENACDENYV
ncbi:amphiregulin [Bombina bombina]|uniref:amphiregulin n=1 Tax=Bombina bombina TaxID=8345 RepID=UPI00235AADFC|nr:amphiregulin [Bombina bombina]